MAELHPMRIGSELVTTGDETTILSPFDGSELGRVAIGTAEQVDAAVAAAQAVRHEPMPAHQRATILDAAAAALTARQPAEGMAMTAGRARDRRMDRYCMPAGIRFRTAQ